MQRRVESGEVRKRYHSFGHALQRKTKKENDLIMDNLQQAPVTQGVNDNKLIAEFMGIESFKDSLASLHQGKINVDLDVYEQAKYHTSWDWLVPTITKIYQLGLDNESALLVRDAVAEANLDNTYNAVVEFIKWYNEKDRFLCGVCGEHVNEYTYNEDKDVDECNKCKL